MNRSRMFTLALGFLALAPAINAGPSGRPQPPRAPVGIHAEVILDEYEAVQLKKNPSMTPTDLDFYFVDLYKRLLSNTAVSGISLGVSWKRLEPHAPTGTGTDGYDWSWTDNLFLQVSAYNAANAGTPGFHPKTVQLGVSPGFNSPQWLLDKLPSCNYLFDHQEQAPPADGPPCGKATFNGFVEGGRKTANGVTTDIAKDLPMPWNPTYKSAWETFLKALAARYESCSEFVSIDVAGPTASSGEMILPSDLNTTGTQIGGLMPDKMWSILLKHFFTNPKLHDNDKAFVDEWEKAINMYGKIFSGITLAVNTGSGLPRFNGDEFTTKPTPSCSDNGTLDMDCQANCPKLNLDCAAETEIMTYFAQPTVGGPNGKSGASDGMRGFGPYIKELDLGEPAVKWLPQHTAVLGGLQFDRSFSMFPVEEGCIKDFPKKGAGKIAVSDTPAECLAPGTKMPPKFKYFNQATEGEYLISPEQAAYNVLLYFFTGTPAGGVYRQAMGAATLNYLQVYGPDIEYANSNPDLNVDVQEPTGPVTTAKATLDPANFTTVQVSAQTLLNQANEQLWSMALEPSIP